MRGDFYRLGRRPTGSIVLALGVAAALAGGGSATATARSATKRHAPVKPPPVMAHATGHKIA
jgi:hypothetical protein